MKVIAVIIATAALAYGYCQHYSKVGEYTPGGFTNYKVCQYSNGLEMVSMRVGAFEMCPLSISYDSYNGNVCGY